MRPNLSDCVVLSIVYPGRDYTYTSVFKQVVVGKVVRSSPALASGGSLPEVHGFERLPEL